MQAPAKIRNSAPASSPKTLDFRAMFEHFPDALMVITSDLRICFGNDAAHALCHLLGPEIEGQFLTDMIDPSNLEAFRFSIAQTLLEKSGPRKEHLRFRSATGQSRELEISLRILPSDRANPKILLACHDISEQSFKLGEAAKLAYVDSLTGLANLRRFEEVADREIKVSQRTSRTFSILLLDLDGLKQINDTLGHLAGNRAICRLADVLREHCRGTDTAGRFGGDEFYLILPETSAGEAVFCSERLKASISVNPTGPALSASIGMATYPSDGSTITELMNAADSRLYLAKRNGKVASTSALRPTRPSSYRDFSVAPVQPTAGR